MKPFISISAVKARAAIRRVGQLAGLLLLLVWSAAAGAQAVGVVTHLSGVLTAKRADGTTAVLAIKSQIQQGDTLITESNTYTRVKFLDNAEIVLRPGSQLVVKSYLYDAEQPQKDNIAISLVKGGLRAVTGLVGKRNHDAVSFETPTATIGIRGTHFGALLCQNDCGGVRNRSGDAPRNGLYVDVAQGAVQVTNEGGTQRLDAGELGYTADNRSAPVKLPPEQGVTVGMPQSISKNAAPPASKDDGNGDC
jgi:hypothetical protein